MCRPLQNKIPPLSIRITLPTLLAILIITTVVIIGGMAFISGQNAVTDLANQLAQEISTRIEDHVRTFLNTPHIIHKFNQVSIENRQINLEDFSELQYIFGAQVDLSESAPFIYYGNELGEFLGIQRETDGSLVHWVLDQDTKNKLVIHKLDENFQLADEIDSVDFDPRSRPWYQAAAESGESTWSPIFPDISRPVLIITAVMPVFDLQTDQIQGVMGIELSLEQLSSFLRNLEISETGQAYIIDRDGNIIASSSQEDPYISTSDGPARLLASESQEPIIQTTTNRILSSYHDFNDIKKKQSFRFSYQGDSQIVQITPFSDNRGIDWLIIVVIPESDLMGPIYKNVRLTIYFGILVLLIAIALGLTISRWIIHPIITITGTASDIEQGEYNISKLDQTSKRKDELGTLSQVFQRMALKVYVREQHLKEQVHKLKIQIDENKKRIQVTEITETDFFRELREKAQKMKDKRSSSDEEN